MSPASDVAQSVTPPAATGAPLLDVRGASKTFGRNQVLRDVDLTLEVGEIHALVGQNGSGKSTLVKLLSGVHAADAGAVITVRGERLSNPVRTAELRRSGMAFVHQDLGLVADRSVLENIRVGQFNTRRWSRRINWKLDRSAAQKTLAALDADIDLDQLAGTLHAGQRAEVAIARALQNQTPGDGCIVFDESTQSLPRETLHEFYATVRALAAAGTSILLVSHRLDEVLDLADRVTVLRDGQVVVNGAQTSGLTEASLTHLVLGRQLESVGMGSRSPQVGSRPAGVGLEVRGVSGAQLDDVTFRVDRCEVVGITGSTESGHEALPYALAGLAAEARGMMRVHQREFSLPARIHELIEAGVVLVPGERTQDGLALDLSALDNLSLPRVMAKGRRLLLRREWQSREFDSAVSSFGLTPAIPHQNVASFSGGNQQKLLLAKWLLADPAVLLLHEPTQAVDVGARVDILRAIRASADAGAAVVVSSIEAQDLAYVSDRVLVMRGGRIAEEIRSDITPDRITSAVFDH